MREAHKKNTGIVLIDREKLDFYDVGGEKIYVFNFSKKLIMDMEIIDRRELETQMYLFINYYKIHPVSLVMILSNDLCFSLQLDDSNETNFENEVNKFIFNLPFEEVIHKIYKQTKNHLLIAVNRDLIENFKAMFKKMGFTVQTIVPIAVTGININSIDKAAVEFILAKTNQLKDQSLIALEQEHKEKKTEVKKVKEANRIYILLGIFTLLLLFLLFLLYKQALGNP